MTNDNITSESRVNFSGLAGGRSISYRKIVMHSACRVPTQTDAELFRYCLGFLPQRRAVRAAGPSIQVETLTAPGLNCRSFLFDQLPWSRGLSVLILLLVCMCRSARRQRRYCASSEDHTSRSWQWHRHADAYSKWDNNKSQ